MPGREGNASIRRKREGFPGFSLSLPDNDKESVHGIIRPLLSEPIPEKLQLVFSRRNFFLLGEKKEETLSTRLRVLAYFKKGCPTSISYLTEHYFTQ
jgi:hypothetical protein